MQSGADWSKFRRMQDSLLAVAALGYAAGLFEAMRVLPILNKAGLQRVLALPALLLVASFVAVRFAPPLRSAVSRHLMASYRTGFGQTVISVLVGLGVVIAADVFLFWQVDGAAHGGRDPGGAFAAFGACIGLFAAQCLLVRRLNSVDD